MAGVAQCVLGLGGGTGAARLDGDFVCPDGWLAGDALHKGMPTVIAWESLRASPPRVWTESTTLRDVIKRTDPDVVFLQKQSRPHRTARHPTTTTDSPRPMPGRSKLSQGGPEVPRWRGNSSRRDGLPGSSVSAMPSVSWVKLQGSRVPQWPGTASTRALSVRISSNARHRGEQWVVAHRAGPSCVGRICRQGQDVLPRCVVTPAGRRSFADARRRWA